MTRKVMIATPVYGGLVTTGYLESIIKTISASAEQDVQICVFTLGDSLVTRARNNIVAYFLDDGSFDYLFWIDADISWSPEQFYRVLNLNREVVCAAYPFKNYQPPEVPTNKVGHELVQSMLRYVTNFRAEDIPEDGFIQVLDAATGFMCIHKSAFDKLIDAYPEDWYIPDMKGVTHLKNHWLFFDTMIQNRRYLSEDYAFCRRCQRAGIPIWLDTNSCLNHTGPHTFSGNLKAYIDDQRS